jgi:putative ABC transport system permease protein
VRPLAVAHLYRARLRSRLAGETLAAIGIAVGVALLFASQVANTSLSGSVDRLTGELVGQSQLQVQARSPEGFPESLLGQVQRLSGVRSAAPVLESQAYVVGPSAGRSVTLVGADPRFVKFGGTLLRHFKAATLARQHAIALPLSIVQQIGAKPLEVVRLEIGGKSMRVLLGVALKASGVGALVDSSVALAPLGYAQQLSGTGRRISRIFVRAQAGHDREVRAGLERLTAGGLNVEGVDYDARLFEEAAWSSEQSTAVFAAISALVGFLFAFNAMLLTVPARRSLIAGLHLDGYSPWAVIEVVLLDALILAVASSVVGLVLGDELSLHLFHGSPGFLSFAFPVGSQRIVSLKSIALAVGAGALTACVGVLIPLQQSLLTHGRHTENRSRKLAKYRPGKAHGMVFAGMGCLVLTTAILLLAPQASVLGVFALTGALLLLLGSLVEGVLALVERLTAGMRARAPFIAVAELRSSWTRTIGIAATGAVAVLASVEIQGAQANVQRGLDRSTQEITNAAAVWVLEPGESNLLATAPFAAGEKDSLTRLAGIESVQPYRGGFLDWDGRRVLVSAQPREALQMVYPGQVVQGSRALANARVRKGDWAVISEAIAKEHHLAIGQTFVLPSASPMSFRVAALSTNLGWPPGSVTINADDYARAWRSKNASAYEISLKAGVSPTLGVALVRKALGPNTGLMVESASQRERMTRATTRQGLARLSAISTLVAVTAVLAMAVAMGAMIWERRHRVARLKLDGFSDTQIWRALVLESALLLGGGCAMGAVFGIYGALLISHALASVTGFPVVFAGGAAIAIRSFAAISIVAVAITAVPGWLVARVKAGA